MPGTSRFVRCMREEDVFVDIFWFVLGCDHVCVLFLVIYFLNFVYVLHAVFAKKKHVQKTS